MSSHGPAWRGDALPGMDLPCLACPDRADLAAWHLMSAHAIRLHVTASHDILCTFYIM